MRFCRRTAEIDSRSPVARSALFTAMWAGAGISDSRPSQRRSSSASATLNLPSRRTGIPSFAQRWATFTGKARNWAMAFQPRKVPGCGATGCCFFHGDFSFRATWLCAFLLPSRGYGAFSSSELLPNSGSWILLRHKQIGFFNSLEPAAYVIRLCMAGHVLTGYLPA